MAKRTLVGGLVLLFAMVWSTVPLSAQVAEARLATPSFSPGAEFGRTLAVDGNTAVVSAPRNNGDKVFVYERNGNEWNAASTLTPPPLPPPTQQGSFFVFEFGTAVAISGDTIVTNGAFAIPTGYGGLSESQPFFAAYTRNGTNWELQAVVDVAIKPEDNGGIGNVIDDIDISGNTVVVGDTSSDGANFSSGIAIVYTRNAATWTQAAILAPSDVASVQDFGISVAVDGTTVVVGNPDDDATVVSAGAAYVFDRDMGGPNTWGLVKKLTASDPGIIDNFGGSVAIDGEHIAVASSSNRDGAAYIFGRNTEGANNWGFVAKASAPPTPDFNTYLFSVALSGDRLILSSLEINRNYVKSPGTVYYFNRNTSGANTWGLTEQFTIAGGRRGSDYGYNIALSGTDALIGAPGVRNRTGAGFIRTLR